MPTHGEGSQLGWSGRACHSVLAVSLDARSGELRSQRLPGDTAKVVGFLERLPGPTWTAYEAGPTGYGLAPFHAGGSPTLQSPTNHQLPQQVDR